MCSCFAKKMQCEFQINGYESNACGGMSFMLFVWSWIQSQLSELFKFASAPCESAESVYGVFVHRIYHHDISWYHLLLHTFSFGELSRFRALPVSSSLVEAGVVQCIHRLLDKDPVNLGHDGGWWAHCSDQNVVNHSETAYPHHASQPSAVEHLQSSHEWKQCHKLGACPLRCQKTM